MTARTPGAEPEALLAAIHMFRVADAWDVLSDAERTMARDFVAGDDAPRRARVVAQALSTGRPLKRAELDRLWQSWQSRKASTHDRDSAVPDESTPAAAEPSPFTACCETAWDPPRRRRVLWRWLDTIEKLVSVTQNGMVPELESDKPVGEPKWRVVLVDEAGGRLTESAWCRNWAEVERLQREWQDRAARSDPQDVYATAHTWPGSAASLGLVRPRPRDA